MLTLLVHLPSPYLLSSRSLPASFSSTSIRDLHYQVQPHPPASRESDVAHFSHFILPGASGLRRPAATQDTDTCGDHGISVMHLCLCLAMYCLYTVSLYTFPSPPAQHQASADANRTCLKPTICCHNMHAYI